MCHLHLAMARKVGLRVDLAVMRKWHTDFGRNLCKTLWSLYAEREVALCSAQIGVRSLTMSLSSSFPCWILEEKGMLEGWEWDSISTALAHCDLCTSLSEFSAFCFVGVFFQKTGAAKSSWPLRGCWACVVFLGKAASLLFSCPCVKGAENPSERGQWLDAGQGQAGPDGFSALVLFCCCPLVCPGCNQSHAS